MVKIYYKVFKDSRGSVAPFCQREATKQIHFSPKQLFYHKEKVTQYWFTKTEMNVMSWPAKSTDLNPKEKFWDILARAVYGVFANKTAWRSSKFQFCENRKILTVTIYIPLFAACSSAVWMWWSVRGVQLSLRALIL